MNLEVSIHHKNNPDYQSIDSEVSDDAFNLAVRLYTLYTSEKSMNSLYELENVAHCAVEIKKMLNGRVRVVDERGRSILHFLAGCGVTNVFVAALQILFKFVNSLDDKLRAPLHWAVGHDHIDIIHALVSFGATLDVPNASGHTPLHIAAHHGFFRSCSILIDGGANINFAGGMNGRTALHIAVTAGHVETVHLLVSRGADLLAPAKGNLTCFHLACLSGFTDIVLVILNAAIDQNIALILLSSATFNENLTAMDICQKFGKIEILSIIQEAYNVLSKQEIDDDCKKLRESAEQHFIEVQKRFNSPNILRNPLSRRPDSFNSSIQIAPPATNHSFLHHFVSDSKADKNNLVELLKTAAPSSIQSPTSVRFPRNSNSNNIDDASQFTNVLLTADHIPPLPPLDHVGVDRPSRAATRVYGHLVSSPKFISSPFLTPSYIPPPRSSTSQVVNLMPQMMSPPRFPAAPPLSSRKSPPVSLPYSHINPSAALRYLHMPVRPSPPRKPRVSGAFHRMSSPKLRNVNWSQGFGEATTLSTPSQLKYSLTSHLPSPPRCSKGAPCSSHTPTPSARQVYGPSTLPSQSLRAISGSCSSAPMGFLQVGQLHLLNANHNEILLTFSLPQPALKSPQQQQSSYIPWRHVKGLKLQISSSNSHSSPITVYLPRPETVAADLRRQGIALRQPSSLNNRLGSLTVSENGQCLVRLMLLRKDPLSGVQSLIVNPNNLDGRASCRISLLYSTKKVKNCCGPFSPWLDKIFIPQRLCGRNFYAASNSHSYDDQYFDNCRKVSIHPFRDDLKWCASCGTKQKGPKYLSLAAQAIN